ncbi:MAG: DUF2798 domain-containing protein [Clostridia bacterium]|nr:DUF2798 domain-containing protein [Clostridia bacterium]
MNETRLPRNGKEALLYGGIICIITVIVMLILNIGTAFGGFSKEAIKTILILIPIIWIIAMLLESLLVGRISEKLVEKFTEPSDGFNTRILFNILFCVTGMSAIMTIIGGMIGEGKLSLEPFITFPSHWPRNFCVAFWCEILLAQPIARKAMKLLHKKTDKKDIKGDD